MNLETFFTVSEQTAQFLLSAVMGAVWGIIYDCFRVLRIVFPPARKTGLVYASDILFLLCCGGTLFIFSYLFCRAEIRLYCIIGGLLGFTLYILTIGNTITGIIRAAANFVGRILRKVYSVLLSPTVKILHFICQKSKLLFVHNYKNLKKIKNSPLTPLKKQDKMLYNEEANME